MDNQTCQHTIAWTNLGMGDMAKNIRFFKFFGLENNINFITVYVHFLSDLLIQLKLKVHP